MNEELIESHRYINVDGDWWYESTLDDWVEVLRGRGLDVASKDILFYGFYSQGDGACFTGNCIDSTAFIREHVDEKDRQAIEVLFNHGGEVYVQVVRGSNRTYSHSRTCYANLSPNTLYQCIDPPADSDGLQATIIAKLDAQIDAEVHAIEMAFTELFRGWMDKIFKDLNEEYDYLTSDEAVWETLVANDMIEPTEGEAA